MNWVENWVEDRLLRIEERLYRLSSVRELALRACARSLIGYLVRRHCTGTGLEIGGGVRPYCSRHNTLFLDKYDRNPPGTPRPDLLADAAAIPLADDSLDFLLSAHCLEHCPDTLKVLYEWQRVLKPGGILFLILPHGERTFDRGRTPHTLAHHLEDHANGVGPYDRTHWEEFLNISVAQADHFWLNDARNPDGSLNFEWIADRAYLHYHVWTQTEMADIVRHLGGEIVTLVEEPPDREDSFLLIARMHK